MPKFYLLQFSTCFLAINILSLINGKIFDIHYLLVVLFIFIYNFAVTNFMLDYKIYLLKFNLKNFIYTFWGGFKYMIAFKIYPNLELTKIIEKDLKEYKKK